METLVQKTLAKQKEQDRQIEQQTVHQRLEEEPVKKTPKE